MDEIRIDSCVTLNYVANFHYLDFQQDYTIILTGLKIYAQYQSISGIGRPWTIRTL